jgi:fluoride ion exporter CrcB/FEX
VHLLVFPDTMINGVSRWTFDTRTHFPVSPRYSAATIAVVIAGAFGIMVFRYRKFGG